jgi:hypothetical protein
MTTTMMMMMMMTTRDCDASNIGKQLWDVQWYALELV